MRGIAPITVGFSPSFAGRAAGGVVIVGRSQGRREVDVGLGDVALVKKQQGKQNQQQRAAIEAVLSGCCCAASAHSPDCRFGI
jgi:hypothetical protein